MENYIVLRALGAGSFGSVFLARHLPTGVLVALKKVRIKKPSDGLPRVLLREVQAMEKLSSSDSSAHSRHILKLREYFAQGAAVVLVMEYCISDLAQVQRSLAATGERMAHRVVKLLMFQLLSGISSMHSRSVIHRDLKPSNLLFTDEGVLRIGDFGLARIHAIGANDPTYSHEVATRWYRSPELLFGARKYGGEVDIWAAGCILYELLHSAPLFCGQNDIDQLYRVLKVTGTPTSENYPNHASLPDYGKIDFPPMQPADWRTLVHAEVGDTEIDLLQSLLRLDPKRRLTASSALQHDYFADIVAARAAGAESARAQEWHEEHLIGRAIARFPNETYKQWQQEREIPTATAQQEELLSSPKATSAASASVATASHAAASSLEASLSDSASSSSSSSALASAASSSVQTASAQLRSMHLTGIEWEPLSAEALKLALHRIPMQKPLRQAFTLDDVCAASY
jgi:cell cycle related kinase